MRALLFYFLQSFVASGLLYGYYHFFLRNKRFHQYNRFYLLAATILSLIVPLLNIDIYYTSQQDIPVVYQLLANVRVGKTIELHDRVLLFSWTKAVQLVYFIIVLLLLFRLCIALIRIVQLRIKYHAERLEKIAFINTQEKEAPFSFFKWLFWNEKINTESSTGKTIFRHELFHIQQKHSWDILYLELLTTIFWINPFFQLIKKETKAIHEFLADRFAAGQDDKWEYAELLVMQTLATRQRLVNPFFHNQIKRRIAMITNSSKSSYQYLRKVMVLPIIFFVVTIIAVNCTAKDDKESNTVSEQKNEPINQKAEETTKEAGTVADNPEIKSPTDESKVITLGDENKIYEKVEIEAKFIGGSGAWRRFMETNLNANVPVDNGAPEGTYQVITQFVVNRDGSMSDLRTLTKHGYGMEKEALRVLKLSPKWMPAINYGHAVTAYRKQPVTFQISSD